MFEISQNPLVNKIFYGVMGALVIGGIALLFNMGKTDDAKIYPKSLITYLEGQYNKDGKDFILTNYMDPNATYVKINGEDTKTLYKYNIKSTLIYYTGGNLDAGTTITASHVPALKDGQVAILLATNSEDLSVCAGTGDNVDLPASATKDSANLDDAKPDICRGYDPSINKVIVVGPANTMKAYYKDVLKNSPRYKQITVVKDSNNSYSGVVIDTTR